jgi:hypothetical protein
VDAQSIQLSVQSSELDRPTPSTRSECRSLLFRSKGGDTLPRGEGDGGDPIPTKGLWYSGSVHYSITPLRRDAWGRRG